MGNRRGITGLHYDPDIKPSRTPGPLGKNDAADPSALAYLGLTPGPLGLSDHADPTWGMGRHFSKQGTLGTAAPVSPICVTEGRDYGRIFKMPVPASNNPPLLSDSDISNAAAALGLEDAVIYAVAKVESGGRTGFDAVGRPKILFEARWFHKFTDGKYDKGYPHLSQPTWQGARQFYRRDQWLRIEQAFRLNKEAALKSSSWGKFQIMGFNHSGYHDVYRFCEAMFASEAEHLHSFLSFCKDNNLVDFLIRKEWSMFAHRYNGAEYKQNKYDTKLQKAYEEYKKRKVEEKIWV